MRREWRRFRGELTRESPEFLPLLRTFRRRMSMRIAWRDIHGFQSCSQSMRDLSALAEFCVQECLQLATDHWSHRYGEPWDDELDQTARFCVLALGKLGGRELNFSSDIDLIYIYEGDGFCRKERRATSVSTHRFFTKVAETLTTDLQEPTEHGFLFRVDLRLRPEGARGPLVCSFSGMENYYAASGQSWERLALIKARSIAGDLSLGGELLESLHSFRYPRHPPASLLGEIAAMKTRTEKEVVGTSNLKRDLKSGYGGIREIEFIVQTMQLLHAGRFPFLQTGSTVEGLEQLVRYELMERPDAEFLKQAYWFFRSVEHRLQIREEQQTHALPTDPEQLTLLAKSFDFENSEAFEKHLDELRSGVRTHYDQLLRSAPVDEELNKWWIFFSEDEPPQEIEAALERWFGSATDARELIRNFVQGPNPVLTRQQVSRFVGVTKCFDRLMPRLASPLEAVRRISRFADSYGTRTQFLSTCSLNPSFFEVLALLFDRSEFIHDLLCRFPEILEEVLRPEILRRRKSIEETLEELAAGAPETDFESWLWLYVKAEQIRIAIGDLLNYLEQEEMEQSLTVLADAVLIFILGRVDPEKKLLAVALGKYGGSEMTFGSDLDLLFLSAPEEAEQAARTVRAVVQMLSRRQGPGGIYEIDLRLRPHGHAGPLVPTIQAMERYYPQQAQPWEKQMLTRARAVTGNAEIRESFEQFIDNLLYKKPASVAEMEELWGMCLRIERERDKCDPPERAFKTGAGGIIDIEFFCQFLQLRHGHLHPELRQPNTRRLLRAIGKLGLMDSDENRILLDNFDFLKRIEVHLRRNRNSTVSVIGASPDELFTLARWNGYETAEDFWEEHCKRLAINRDLIADSVQKALGIDLPTISPEPSEKPQF